MVSLPEAARELLDGPTFWTLATVNRDGSPQSSVVWARRDGDDVLMSTIHGRRKYRNLLRDPRVSVSGYDPANPYRYVEIRGTATMAEPGGDELIDELSRRYRGAAWRQRPDETRVVVRVTPTRTFVRPG